MDLSGILGQYYEGKRVLQIMPAPVGLVVCEYNSFNRQVTVTPCLGLALVEKLDGGGLGVVSEIEPIVYHPEGFLIVGGDGHDFYPHDDHQKTERVHVFTLPLREVEGYFTGPEYPAASVTYWGIPGKESATA